MRPEEFDRIVAKTFASDVLAKKGKVYASQDDRLANFKVAARNAGVISERALWMYRLKHETAMLMELEKMERLGDKYQVPLDLWSEWIGDSLNYLLLLKALLTERSQPRRRL